MKKIISVLTTVLLLCPVFACAVFAADGGTVYISFEDFGERAAWDDPADLDYPQALGVIIPETAFRFSEGDTLADAVTAFLTSEGVSYKADGSTKQYGYFYLKTIGNITLPDGTLLPEFGEYSSGSWSGWMVRVNNQFPDSSLSEYKAEDGDVIRFMNSCQGGPDVGSDYTVESAAFTGVETENAKLSPAFSSDIKDYTLTVPYDAESIRLTPLMENYSARVTVTADGKVYKYNRDIPVENGTVITVTSEYYGYDYATYESVLRDTDAITLTVVKAEKDDGSVSLWQRIVSFFRNLIEFIRTWLGL